MVDASSKKHKKQSLPRAGRKSSSRALPWSNLQQPPSMNAAESEILRDQKITPIITGVQISSPTERVQNLTAACSMIQDQSCRKLLLKDQIIRIVMEQCLLDSTQDVVTAGWGFLNALVAVEGYDIAVHLYRKGILKRVYEIIDNINASVDKLKAKSTTITPAVQALLWNCTDSVISLLTSLSETTQEILEAISTPKILKFVSKLVNSSTNAPEQVQTVATVFLDRVTDDNEIAYKLLSEDSSFIGQLLQLDMPKTDGPLLRITAACSTLHNLIVQSHSLSDEFSDEYNISDAKLAEPLTKVIQIILSKPEPSKEDQTALFVSFETLADLADQTVEKFGNQVPIGANGLNGNQDEMDEDEDDDEKMIDDISEIEEEEEEEEEGEEGEDEDDDPELPDELGEDLAMVTGEEGTAARSSTKKPVNEPVLEYLTSSTIPTILPLSTSTPTTEFERHIKLQSISLLSSISRAFIAISSKKSKLTLSPALLDNYTPITHTIWNTLITPILLSNSADLPLAERITNLATHITSFTKTVDVSQNQHKSFLALYNAVDVSLKVECIKVLSNIAQSQGSDRIEINKEIGTFLISTVNTLPYPGDEPAPSDNTVSVAPQVIIECLNAVYDIYADKDFDYDEEVFVKLGFLKYLKSFVIRVKTMAKKIDKRKHTELRESADEALLNLNAFVKYKVQERE